MVAVKEFLFLFNQLPVLLQVFMLTGMCCAVSARMQLHTSMYDEENEAGSQSPVNYAMYGFGIICSMGMIYMDQIGQDLLQVDFRPFHSSPSEYASASRCCYCEFRWLVRARKIVPPDMSSMWYSSGPCSTQLVGVGDA